MMLAEFWNKLVGWFSRTPARDLNFTPRAQQAFAHARREAVRQHHGRVETLHLWLALLRMEKSAGSEALRRLGVDPAALRRDLESLTSPAKMVVEAKPLQYSYNLKKTLALAVKEAKALNHRYVGTDHLLLGLLRLGGEPVTGQLRRHSVSLDKARAGIRTQEAGDPPV